MQDVREDVADRSANTNRDTPARGRPRGLAHLNGECSDPPRSHATDHLLPDSLWSPLSRRAANLIPNSAIPDSLAPPMPGCRALRLSAYSQVPVRFRDQTGGQMESRARA